MSYWIDGEKLEKCPMCRKVLTQSEYDFQFCLSCLLDERKETNGEQVMPNDKPFSDEEPLDQGSLGELIDWLVTKSNADDRKLTDDYTMKDLARDLERIKDAIEEYISDAKSGRYDPDTFTLE